MLNVDPLISWTYEPDQAIQIQENLRHRLVLRWDDRPVKTIAGVDFSFSNGSVHAAIVVFRYPELTRLAAATGEAPETFPYVPGLLAFRVGPAILDAWHNLKLTPDLILVHGHGIAHPRGMGMASHLGLWLNLPTVGVAKSQLYGRLSEVGPHLGDYGEIRDEKKPHHIIGASLRSQVDSRAIYVSPGHLIDLDHSIKFILACCQGYRLPEPVRAAAQIASTS